MRRLSLLLAACLLALGACSDDSRSSAVSSTTAPPESTSTSTSVPATTIVPSVPPTLMPSRGTIGLLGDSLLHQAREEVEAQLAGFPLVIRSAPGLEAFDARHMVSSLREDGAGSLGVVLGTNNARDGYEPRDLRVLTGIARATAFAPCQRWVTVTETTPSEPFNDAARKINEGLAELADTYAGLELVDWAGAMAEHPEWLADDGLHHTPEGQEALARLLASALAECRSEPGS